MTRARQMWTVAGWEFRRYFKWKDQLYGILFFIGISGLAWFAGWLGTRDDRDTVTIAVVGSPPPAAGRVTFVAAAATDSARLQAVRAGDIDGVLTERADGQWELLVEKEPSYRTQLGQLLGDQLRRERLATMGLTEAELARFLEPARLDVRFLDPERGERGGAEKVAAGIVIFIMCMAVLNSLAYLLTGITSEKQTRVTECVVSAISPQAWIDGKVLGITGFTLVSMANMAVGSLVLAFAARFVWDFPWPDGAIRASVILTLVLFGVLGLLLWNSFFAAVAATINDPNTSARTSLMMLPLIPVVMSIAVLRDPESLISRFLAVFPLTSAPALPMRMVLGDPGLLEIVTSIVLLAGAIWLMRRLAGGIFEVGMLIYGKEPTLREMARWARGTS
jgi:ABC-2 type transport system permease protein